ncbi:hydrolase [Bacillus gobiensis]
MKSLEKNTYYVSLVGQMISQSPDASSWDFKIFATPDEIRQLRALFDQLYSSDVKGYLRSHIPFLEYHNDQPNDDTDHTANQIYRLLYDLGDENTREFINDEVLRSAKKE